MSSNVTGQNITVVSTFTEDILLDSAGNTLGKQDGGPGYFLSRALESTGMPFRCLTGNLLTVEILITPNGEFGRIPIVPAARALPAKLGDWVIVSTVLDEWQLTPKSSLPQRLFVDVQGFVRNGAQFGQKQPWLAAAVLAEDIYCLKGTREEVSTLPKAVIERQKQRLLVITDGAKGVELYDKGVRTRIAVEPITGLDDTIGAGDTFFGNFVAQMYNGHTPQQAAQAACQATSQFLMHKQQQSMPTSTTQLTQGYASL